MNKVARHAGREVSRIADEVMDDWKGRYGNNALVGGNAPLAQSTIDKKGHDRQLEEDFTLRNSIQRFPKSSYSRMVLDNTITVSARVYTDNWLFAVHEYGLGSTGMMKFDIPARPTLALTDQQISRFAPRYIRESIEELLVI